MAASNVRVPVIAIDGPSASGKGTVAERVARALGYHYLDSGAIYRAAALAALHQGIPLDDEASLAKLAARLDLSFRDGVAWLDGKDMSQALREEATGSAASRIAALPELRKALLARQRAFRKPPGLVADGRDMGSVVFADADLKVFLTASPEARAERRYKQLMEKGMSANIAAILEELRQRDARDAGRAAAPLTMSDNAMLLDTSGLTVDEVVERVLAQHARMSHRQVE